MSADGSRIRRLPWPAYPRGVGGYRQPVAPARSHSTMVVRCSWGEVVVKPWSPK